MEVDMKLMRTAHKFKSNPIRMRDELGFHQAKTKDCNTILLN